MEVPISIPLDSDGFVRRACPACEREFKWLYADDEDEATEPDARGYCCPYCAAWAQQDQWFTESQVEYIQQVGSGVVSGEVDQIFSQFNRPGSALKYTPGDRPPALRELPPEPDDMRRVEFGCHSEDPLKVAEDWDKPVHCLICGSSV
jgi:hypothetical protein